MPVTRKPHPAEAHEREQLRRCVRFHAFIFLGRGRKRHGMAAGSIRDAATTARQFEREARVEGNHRGAMVYGFTPEGEKVWVGREHWGVPTPEDMMLDLRARRQAEEALGGPGL